MELLATAKLDIGLGDRAYLAVILGIPSGDIFLLLLVWSIHFFAVGRTA